MQTLRSRWQSLPRGVVVLITALAIYVPLSLIVYQSFLSAPFFMPSKELGLEAFRFIFDDPDFYKALVSGRPSARGAGRACGSITTSCTFRSARFCHSRSRLRNLAAIVRS